jgi:hypothetical protein
LSASRSSLRWKKICALTGQDSEIEEAMTDWTRRLDEGDKNAYIILVGKSVLFLIYLTKLSVAQII